MEVGAQLTSVQRLQDDLVARSPPARWFFHQFGLDFEHVHSCRTLYT